MNALMSKVAAFVRDEEGVALTEYLILLGILTAAVIAAVGLAGDNLALAWGNWANFFDDLGGNVPTVPAG